MRPTESDPVIDEIREVRHRISARFDHDPARLVDYYIQLQESHRHRLIDAPKTADRKDEPSARPEG